MYRSMFEGVEKGPDEGLSSDPALLYRAFEQVTDGRKAKGKRYPLALLLTLLMLGKLAGETTVNGSVGWPNERQADSRRQLHWPKRQGVLILLASPHLVTAVRIQLDGWKRIV